MLDCKSYLESVVEIYLEQGNRSKNLFDLLSCFRLVTLCDQDFSGSRWREVAMDRIIQALGLDHQPSIERVVLSIVLTLVSIVAWGRHVTPRLNRLLPLAPEKELAKNLERLRAWAPSDATIPWVITRDNQLLVGGEEKISDNPISESEIEMQISEMVRRLEAANRRSRTKSKLEGLQLSIFDLTALFKKGYIKEGHLKNSSLTSEGMVIARFTVLGHSLSLYVVGYESPIKFWVTGHPLGSPALVDLKDTASVGFCAFTCA